MGFMDDIRELSPARSQQAEPGGPGVFRKAFKEGTQTVFRGMFDIARSMMEADITSARINEQSVKNQQMDIAAEERLAARRDSQVAERKVERARATMSRASEKAREARSQDVARTRPLRRVPLEIGGASDGPDLELE